MTTFGLLIFDEAEELDFCGPWEVFTASSMIRDFSDQVMLIAEQPGPVRCGKGMRITPDCALEDAPPLDLLPVPGGRPATDRKVPSPAARRATALALGASSPRSGPAFQEPTLSVRRGSFQPGRT